MFDILLSEMDMGKNPLYMQIYKQIRDHIRKGVIPHGARLPSIRSLQTQLNISKTPIETAYHMLNMEGYVISRERSGLFAVNIEEGILPDQKINDIPSRAKHSINDKTQPAEKKININFHPATIDKEMFPLRTWKKMINNAIEDHAKSIGRYGDMQGEEDFRAILAGYLKNSRGVICSPEQIVVGVGISYSISILAKLLEEIQYIAFEEPGFASAREQFQLSHFELLPIPVARNHFFIKELEGSKAQMVYVTPSHQFPTGRVMPYSERKYLLNWANRQSAYVIEDDYDGEFRYFGKPIPSLQSLDENGRVIYIGTFSKAFTPALRMNYMVLPVELVSRLGNIRHLLLCPSRVEQWAMKSFMEQGHWYRHIRRMRNLYKKKHLRLIEFIRTHFGSAVEITGHSAGLHIQVTVKTRMSAGELVRLAEDKGVEVYDFKQMWMNPVQLEYPHIYLGFGGMSEADMETGIILLKEAWASILEK
ncbi:MocR-like pyridoxine biosynthesis transcription factor PdxR [Aneurinibacillus sp. REN35]|uniref:MocR-like pyridoxine biosynthesis transcription factor PdxR n=1 Tax=Aneurinibacillus sp. REN35 TaxID=3237286 RepID=UPI0035295371